MRSLSRADEKSFSAQHELRPERDHRPELGYRHTLNQRRVEFSNAPRPRRAEMTLGRAVEQCADALYVASVAKGDGRPLVAKERAALKRAGAALDRRNLTMRREIRYVVERDDRAWQALVELSGAERAAALVNEVVAARAQQRGLNPQTTEHTLPGSGSGTAGRFADMTREERQDRRNAFRAPLREVARQPVARDGSQSTKDRGRGGPEIGD